MIRGEDKSEKRVTISVAIMPCLDLPVMLKYRSSSPVIVVNVEPIMMQTTLLQQVSLLH